MDRNKRRVMIVVVVVFVIILSFFAGRYSKGKATVYTTTESGNVGATSSYDSVGVPPDSLHH